MENQIEKRSKDVITKSNKLVNGYFDKFLPSYLDVFDYEPKSIVESYKVYYKINLAITEILEYIDIFTLDNIYDIDKRILTANLKSMKSLVEQRWNKISEQMEEKKNGSRV